MNGFKGAPGEWRYYPVPGEVRGGGGVIAELVMSGSEDENGRLIAASPELLQSLQFIVDSWESNGHLSPTAIVTAKRVINKALGRNC